VRTAVLTVALKMDELYGEPPSLVHPVVWMGHALAWLEAHAPHSAAARLAYGCAVSLGLPAAWGCLAGIVERRAPWPVQALLLKPTFAGRALLAAARRVEDALDAGRLGEARQELGSLVSRPTAELDDQLARAAAIESLAENFVDSWLAPLASYALFGLGGAYAYRAANTADAMWGYHTPRYEWLGKAAARLDDVLNWAPARLGTLLLVLSADRRRAALTAWWRDAGRTASPNAGQPMACVAGALDVRLEKRGHYLLNRTARLPGPGDIAQARRLVRRAMVLAAVAAGVFGGARQRV